MHDAREMEHVIRLIPGVLEVRIAATEDAVEEIHVLSSADRHAMQLVRDVESTLAAHFRLTLDRRVISVAQIEDGDTEESRMILDTVQLKMQGDVTEVQVELVYGNERYVGAHAGPSTRMQRIRSVIVATMAAVQQTLPAGVRIFLEDVSIVSLGSDEAIVAIIGCEDHASEEALVGCAFVVRDEAESAARASLSAINRRLPVLKGAALNRT